MEEEVRENWSSQHSYLRSWAKKEEAFSFFGFQAALSFGEKQTNFVVAESLEEPEAICCVALLPRPHGPGMGCRGSLHARFRVSLLLNQTLGGVLRAKVQGQLLD